MRHGIGTLMLPHGEEYNGDWEEVRALIKLSYSFANTSLLADYRMICTVKEY
jgi:hypothetical protein